MMFSDRTDAGRQLAGALERFRSSQPLVLALPRGGVLVGAVVARALGGQFDVALVKKLRAPGSPELALGAVSEDGNVFLNQEVINLTDADESYVQSEIKERQGEIAQQRKLYRTRKPKLPVAGRSVILTDDGLATGATMIAAVQATALARPQRLVVAVPVSGPEALRSIQAMKQVDETVCLLVPSWFEGVGQFYRNFTQVEDDEVVKVLDEFA
jgi:putative phosphoribosyl transferase